MIVREDLQAFCEARRVLSRAQDFIYLLPHPALWDWVSNYTVTFPHQEMMPEDYTVIPHGSATLVFSLDRRGDLRGDLFGPATRPCTVGKQANQCDMLFIIEFQPAGLFAFTGIEQRELADRTIPFDLVNPALCRQVTDILVAAHSLRQLVEYLDKLLLESLRAAYPPALRPAVRIIVESGGNISAKALSGEVYYSQRHLGRIFGQYLGLGVKPFCRLVRVNKTIRLLHDPQNSVTRACDLAGFYDLPHLIHDFKAVCGITPRQYRDRMSGFYSEIAKF